MFLSIPPRLQGMTRLLNSPWGRGAAVFLVSVCVGLSLPPTRTWLGQVADLRWAEGNKVFISYEVKSLAYGNGKYVAGGTYGYLAYSTDGIVWTQGGGPQCTGQTGGEMSQREIFSIAYGNGRFVALGTQGKGCTSPDGIAWTPISITQVGTYVGGVPAVAFGDGKFVALGQTGKSSTSLDGITWTTGGEMPEPCRNPGIASMVYGNGKFLALSSYGKGCFSTDGVTWTSVDHPNFNGKYNNSVAFGNGRFVAVSPYGKSSTSTDGAAWTPVSNLGIVGHITYGNGAFVVMGNNGNSAYSTDGVTWTAIPPIQKYVNSIAAGNGRFVAAGRLEKSAYLDASSFPSPDYRASLSLTGPSTVSVNVPAVYTVTITNTGNDPLPHLFSRMTGAPSTATLNTAASPKCRVLSTSIDCEELPEVGTTIPVGQSVSYSVALTYTDAQACGQTVTLNGEPVSHTIGNLPDNESVATSVVCQACGNGSAESGEVCGEPGLSCPQGQRCVSCQSCQLPSCFIVSGVTEGPMVTGWYNDSSGTYYNGQVSRMVTNAAKTYWQIYSGRTGGVSLFSNWTTDPTQGTWTPSSYASGTISVIACPDPSDSSASSSFSSSSSAAIQGGTCNNHVCENGEGKIQRIVSPDYSRSGGIWFGKAVASADIDKDGTVDIAVMAMEEGATALQPVFWRFLLTPSGAVKSSDKVMIDPSRTDTTYSPVSLDLVGDIDGNGAADFIVGFEASREGYGESVLLLFNTDGSVKSKKILPSVMGSIRQVGAGIGDIDGDGVPDVAVGSISTTGIGEVAVGLLTATGDVKTRQTLRTTVGLPVVGLGSAIDSLGDFNGDGRKEIVVGINGYGIDPDHSGAVAIISLKNDGTAYSGWTIMPGTAGFTGTITGDDFGSAVAGIGDWDGDGVNDIAVGNIDHVSPTTEDGVWILNMRTNNSVKSFTRVLPSQLFGDYASLSDWGKGYFGEVLASYPDRDGDGKRELIVGLPTEPACPLPYGGAVWIVNSRMQETCAADCLYCAEPVCGNNRPDSGEACGETGLPACASGRICRNCQCLAGSSSSAANRCGNGQVDSGEQCDRGTPCTGNKVCSACLCVSPLACSTVGNYPAHIAITRDGTQAYVTNYPNDTLSIVSVPTGSVLDTVTLPDQPLELLFSPDGTKAYILSIEGKTVSVLSTDTRRITGSMALPLEPEAAAITPDGKKIFVVDHLSTSLAVLSTELNAVSARITVGKRPVAVTMSPDGTRVYISNFESDSISVISTALDTLLATVNVGDGPYSVAFSADGTKAYVGNSLGNSVSVIDVASSTVRSTINVGEEPMHVATAPDGMSVYVANNNADTVSVISTASDTVVATIPVGKAPLVIAFSPLRNKAYIANQGNPAVASVIDMGTKSVVATIPLPHPLDVAVTPDGTKALMLNNFEPGSVSFIDTATDTVLNACGAGVSSSSSALPSVVCGDGLKQGSEACDDGNTSGGDGCSASCAVESGGQCFDVPAYRFTAPSVQFDTTQVWDTKTVALDSQHALIAYQKKEQGMVAKVATVQNGQVTFGPAAFFHPSGGVGGNSVIDMQKLDGTHAVLTYMMYTSPPNSPKCRAVVAEVSGNTVSFGNPVDLVGMTANDSCTTASVAVLSPTQIVVGRVAAAWQGGDVTSMSYGVTTGSVSGKQLSLTLPFSVLTTDAKYYILRAVDATRVMAFGYTSNTDQLWARVGQISGTAISWGTEAKLPAIWPESNSFLNSIVSLSPTRVLLVSNTTALRGNTPIDVRLSGKEITAMHRYPVIAPPLGKTDTTSGEAIFHDAQSFEMVHGACLSGGAGNATNCEGHLEVLAAPMSGIARAPTVVFERGGFVGDASLNGLSVTEMGISGILAAYTYRTMTPDEIGKAAFGARTGVVSACVPASTCGNGTVEGFEECDTGHACAAGYSCSQTCRCEQTIGSSASSSSSSPLSSSSAVSSSLSSVAGPTCHTCPAPLVIKTSNFRVVTEGGKQLIRHTVTLRNNSTVDSRNTYITAHPSQMIITPFSPSLSSPDCALKNGDVTCPAAGAAADLTLAPGQTISYDLVYERGAAQCIEWAANAQAHSLLLADHPPHSTSDMPATIVGPTGFFLPCADNASLELSITGTEGPIPDQSERTYQVTVRNNGSTARQVELQLETDRLLLVSSRSSGECITAPTRASRVICGDFANPAAAISIAAGGSKTFSFAFVNDPANPRPIVGVMPIPVNDTIDVYLSVAGTTNILGTTFSTMMECSWCDGSSSSSSSFSPSFASSASSASSQRSISLCPNGTLDGDETCDIGICCPAGQMCDQTCHCTPQFGSSSSHSFSVSSASSSSFYPTSTSSASSVSSVIILVSSSSASSASPVCGNGNLEGTEQCEAGMTCTNGKVCTNCVCTVVGFCGDDIVDPLRAEECEQNEDCPAGSVCSYQCQCEATQGECGNGILEGSESCESGHSCAVAGQICNNCLCADPPRCGNATLEYLEECEADLPCSTGQNCTNCICYAQSACGNDVLEAGEQCEEGDDCLPGQTCNRTSCRCEGQPQQYCGDTVLDTGEECEMNAPCTEEGKNCDLTTCRCVKQQVVLSCGDGTIDAGEDCEIGIMCPDANMACSFANCHCYDILPRCGDGKREGAEQCEIGAACPQPGEACDISSCRCAPPDPSGQCGNGIISTGEECEVGVPCPFGWACDFPRCACMDQAVCGDGVLDPGETCETTAACAGEKQVCDFSRCRCTGRIYVCGNAVRDPGEECDDGNTVNDDGCSKSCKRETLYSFVGAAALCGNGIVEGMEECDDANLFSNDGCSAFCLFDVNLQSPGPDANDGASSIGIIVTPLTPSEGAQGASSAAEGQALSTGIPSRPSEDNASSGVRPAGSPLASIIIPFPRFSAPVLPVEEPSLQPYPYGITQPLPIARGPITATGPETAALLSAGAALGFSWVRRRKRENA